MRKRVRLVLNPAASALGVACGIVGQLEQRHAEFRATPGARLVRIHATPEDASVAISNDRLISLIEQTLRSMMRKMKVKEYTGPMDTSNWKGYYLKSTGRHAVSERGIRYFQEAIKEDLISEEFMSTCIETGITMLKFNC